MLDSLRPPRMSSNDDTSTKKIKRTSFSPWSSGMMTSRAIASDQPQTRAQEPPRVVSDILDGAAVKSSVLGPLAGSAKIMAAQKEWERNRSVSMPEENGVLDGQTPNGRGNNHQPGPTPYSQSPVPLPVQPSLRKRDAPASVPEPSNPKRQALATDPRREDLLRLTEAEVAKQVSELTGKSLTPSLKASVMNAAASSAPSSSQGPLSFASSEDLLKRVLAEVAIESSQSPQESDMMGAFNEKAPAPVAVESIEPIRMAEPHRPYTHFQSYDGTMLSARGALIPANYQLHENPHLPFVCPVRDCRRLFSGLKGLGGHFGAGHCSTTFNDNGDGTLTKIGSYIKQGGGGSPGIVISTHPLPPDAPPPADASLPMMAMQKRNANMVPLERKPSMRLNEVNGKVSASPAPGLPASTDVQGYLHRLLSPTQRVWGRDDITYMLSLPRKRALPEVWINHHRNSELDTQHYACALAYLTGKEVTGPHRCKMAETNYRATSRLGSPCIALPPSMPASTKLTFSSVTTCVGCKYYSHLQRRSNQCDWGVDLRHKRMAAANMGVPPVTASVEEAIDLEAMDVDEFAPSVAGSDSAGESAPEQRRAARQPQRSPLLGQPAIREPSASTGFTGQLGQFGGNELEMEEWEVAPGRIQDPSTSDNIAFSNSYLTAGQPVTVSEDISFNVIVIKPGGSNHWTVEDDKLRTCSLASGKVRVTMGDKTFQLGPNGMFVVKPGQTCKIENRLYQDSVVHCTTIADFSLQ